MANLHHTRQANQRINRIKNSDFALGFEGSIDVEAKQNFAIRILRFDYIPVRGGDNLPNIGRRWSQNSRLQSRSCWSAGWLSSRKPDLLHSPRPAFAGRNIARGEAIKPDDNMKAPNTRMSPTQENRLHTRSSQLGQEWQNSGAETIRERFASLFFVSHLQFLALRGES